MSTTLIRMWYLSNQYDEDRNITPTTVEERMVWWPDIRKPNDILAVVMDEHGVELDSSLCYHTREQATALARFLNDELILEHQDLFKSELLRLAEQGAARPAKDTLLGQALALFTNDGEESLD